MIVKTKMESESFIRDFCLLYDLYKLYGLYEAYEITQRKRRWWVREVNLNRNELGFFKSCLIQMKLKDEEHFLKATRLSVSKFELILNLLKARLTKHSRRKPIAPEDRLAVTLMYFFLYIQSNCKIKAAITLQVFSPWSNAANLSLELQNGRINGEGNNL